MGFGRSMKGAYGFAGAIALYMMAAGCASETARLRAEWHMLVVEGSKRAVLAIVNESSEAIEVNRVVVNEGKENWERKVSPARRMRSGELALLRFDEFRNWDGPCLLPYSVSIYGPRGLVSVVAVAPLPLSLPQETAKCTW